MGITTTIAACICGVLTAASLVQQAGWRGIVPLHSTRLDVERLIGSPMRPGGITYDLQTERVNVGYSHGGCEKGEEWNVPAYDYGPSPASARQAYANEVTFRTPYYRNFFKCVLSFR